MLLPGLTNVEIGSVGEAFVKYKLHRWGERVIQPGEGLPYDLVVMRQGQAIRIQVKSKTVLGAEYVYKFKTTRGGTKQPYEKNDFDIMACVALDIEEVLFVPMSKGHITNLNPNKFGDGADVQSWYEMLDKLGY